MAGRIQDNLKTSPFRPDMPQYYLVHKVGDQHRPKVHLYSPSARKLENLE